MIDKPTIRIGAIAAAEKAYQACHAINPSNPQAVAEQIKNMYRLCKQIKIVYGGTNLAIDKWADEVLTAIDKGETK